jgi:hypothetical protein
LPGKRLLIGLRKIFIASRELIASLRERNQRGVARTILVLVRCNTHLRSLFDGLNKRPAELTKRVALPFWKPRPVGRRSAERFPKANTGATPVLVDKVDTRSLQSASYNI